jgi:hypothetical protein
VLAPASVTDRCAAIKAAALASVLDRLDPLRSRLEDGGRTGIFCDDEPNSLTTTRNTTRQ